MRELGKLLQRSCPPLEQASIQKGEESKKKGQQKKKTREERREKKHERINEKRERRKEKGKFVLPRLALEEVSLHK